MPSQTQEKKPPRLSELQDWLRWIFTEPRGIDAALEGAEKTLRRTEPKPRLLSWIADGPPIDVKHRLAVYADGYFMRLLDSLDSDFKTMRRALGETPFRQLVADYLKAHPSNSPNIGDVGEAFPSFIRSHDLNRHFPFLGDLATLEWSFLECLQATRLPPLDPVSLQKVNPEAWPSARLVLDPTVRLLDLEWPVHKLWKRRDLPETKGGRRLKRPSRQRLLLFRDDDWVNIHPIGTMEFLMLQELLKGRTLGEACLKLQNHDPKAATAELKSWFAGWTSSGVVKRVEFPKL